MKSVSFNIPDEYTILVGNITIAWSNLEGYIDALIHSMLTGTDSHKKYVTNMLEMSSKIRLLRVLAHDDLCGGPMYKSLDNWLTYIDSTIRPARNDNAHARWWTVTTFSGTANTDVFSEKPVLKVTKPQSRLTEVVTSKNWQNHLPYLQNIEQAIGSALSFITGFQVLLEHHRAGRKQDYIASLLDRDYKQIQVLNPTQDQTN